MIAALHSYLIYLSRVGVYHELHYFFTWILSFFPNGGTHYMGQFVQDQVIEGQRQKSKGALEKDESKPMDDFLTKLLRMHALQPDRFTMGAVFSTCGSNIGAGSDTTSVSLAAILFCLMKSPATVRKVRDFLLFFFYHCGPHANRKDCVDTVERRNRPSHQRARLR